MGTRKGALCAGRVSVVRFETSMGRHFRRPYFMRPDNHKNLWPEDAILSRYDALFLFCIALQYAMLHLGLETQDEAKLILIFHVTGTVMEIFKVWSGSWIYPETAIFAIAGVPLFSGFMYASVGSFIVRVIRAFHMKFAPFPPIWRTWVLAILIYVNFFSHHYIPDARFVLISATVILIFQNKDLVSHR